jgi:hemolysin III
VTTPPLDRVDEPRPALRGVLHLAAFPVSLLSGGILVGVAAGAGATAGVTAAVYAVSASVLFGVSALYHRGRWSERAKARLQRLDHSNIFLLIAGTYTPVAALLLGGTARVIVLTLVWVGAVVGVLLRTLWAAAPRWLFIPLYITLGWVALGVLPDLVRRGGGLVTALLVAGGVAYTAGAIIVALRRPNPAPRVFGYHEVFHVMTLGGYGAHYAAVVLAVLAGGAGS